MPPTPILHTTNLSIGYAGTSAHTVARGLHLHLHAGELVALLGPNGAGKSTLIRTLAGMQPPLAGTVQLDGVDLTTLPARERARRLSVVLTERPAVEQLRVRDLVALGRHPYTDWFGNLNAADHAMIEQSLAAVAALEFADRPFHTLSDGERQRVLIARALAQEPRLLILDEPTAFLDLPRRVSILHLLRRLAHRTRRAILLSTHDLELALHTADLLWLLDEDGTLYTGAPEDLVLAGTLARVFARDGVVFDMQSGSFRSPASSHSTAHLHAPDVPAMWRIWTERALQRGGVQVVAAQTPAAWQITLGPSDIAPDAIVWWVQPTAAPSPTPPPPPEQHTSLYALVRHVTGQAA